MKSKDNTTEAEFGVADLERRRGRYAADILCAMISAGGGGEKSLKVLAAVEYADLLIAALSADDQAFRSGNTEEKSK